MADEVKRLNYFNLQFLRENDFNDEQRYHLQYQRDHLRLLHTAGISEGLEVLDPSPGATSVTVSAGVAFDAQGRRVVLASNKVIELAELAAGQAFYLCTSYRENQSDPTNETGITGNTRWTEVPLLEVLADKPDNSNKLILARLSRTGNVISSVDRSERRIAGVKGGDLEVRRLMFSSQSVVPAGWVNAQLIASGTVRLAGSLTVDGTISGNLADNTVQTADLIDNAITSAKLAEADGSSAQNTNAGSGVKTGHLQDGAVTLQKLAAAVQPIVSLDGVASPGGNIDLVAANTVSIVPNVPGRVITIGETHSGRTDNPHGTTALQVGALISVEGVANPGGNIDLVPANAITIAGNNTTKQITLGETHSVRTDNPHATTAAQVGALPATGGDITGNLSVSSSIALGSTSNSFRFYQVGGDHVVEDAPISIRRAGVHRWRLDEFAGTGLRFVQVYNDASVLQNRTVLQLPDAGDVAVRVSGRYLVVDGGGNEQAYLGGDGAGGDVHIGSLNSGVANLAAYNSASGTYMKFFCSSVTQLSDLAEKQNIAPLNNMLDKVKRLRGVSFEWKQAQPHVTRADSQLGVIAQEVQEVLPEAVDRFPHGKYGVSYTALVPVLIEAVKELAAEVEALRQLGPRCQQLEQELARLGQRTRAGGTASDGTNEH